MTDRTNRLLTNALVEQNAGWLTAYLLAMTGDINVAEDLLQEVFLRAMERQYRFDGARSLGAWLRGIARHVLQEYWRRAGRAPVISDGAGLEWLEIAAEEAEQESTSPGSAERGVEMLVKCMRRLTERARAMLRYKYEESWTSKMIAMRMKMRTSAVDMALSRARKMLFVCVKSGMKAAEHDI